MADKVSDVAGRLADIMEDNGMNQRDIGRRCDPYCKMFNENISHTNISNYVNGLNVPSAVKLTILSLALNVSEAWLLGYDVVKERNGSIVTPYEMDLLKKYRNLSDEGKYFIDLAIKTVK